MNFEGTYLIKHFLVYFLRPKLILFYRSKSKKLEGYIKFIRWQKRIKVVKVKSTELLLKMHIDILEIEIIINFKNKKTFEGFLDTPIGNFHFSGVRLED